MDLRTPVISLHNTNWSIFITEMECVYYAARNDSLNVTQINFVFSGFALKPQKPSVTEIQSFWMSKVILYIVGRRILQSTVQHTTKEWTLQWPLTLTIPYHLFTPLLKNSAVPHFKKIAAPCWRRWQQSHLVSWDAAPGAWNWTLSVPHTHKIYVRPSQMPVSISQTRDCIGY